MTEYECYVLCIKGQGKPATTSYHTTKQEMIDHLEVKLKDFNTGSYCQTIDVYFGKLSKHALFTREYVLTSDNEINNEENSIEI
jgi:hypothetical protein